MSSMFDGLYIARSGVRSSRVALNITGQNITNANTDGYTRQRVDLNSIPPTGYGGQWAVVGASSGNGSSADGIEQLRDKFLDYEFRTQNAKSGDSSTALNTLYDMEDIFTTTTTAASSSESSVVDVLSDEFQNFLTEMEGLTSSSCNVSESDVRDEAGFLTEKLNTAAKALEIARDHQYTALKDDNVGTVNTLLKNIASLSKQIKKSEISGEPVLELQDQRNLMLDNLSKYVPISVRETPETLSTGKTVDTMSVCLADLDGNPLTYSVDGHDTENYTLLGGPDGSSYAQFSVKPSDTLQDSDKVQIFLSRLSTDNNPNGCQYDSGGTINSINNLLSSLAANNKAITDNTQIISDQQAIIDSKTSLIDSINASMPNKDEDPTGYKNAQDQLTAARSALGSAQTAQNTARTNLGKAQTDLQSASASLSSYSSDITGLSSSVSCDVSGKPVSGTASWNGTVLVSGNSSASFQASASAGGNIHLDVSSAGSPSLFNPVPDSVVNLRKDANSELETGNFAGYLKLLNENGEYDTPTGGTTTTFRGIGFYSKYLDTLAKNLATTLNTLNSKLGTDNNDDALLTGTDAGADSISAVTAKNIHVAGVWTDGHLLMTKDPPASGDKNGKSFSNINTMITKLQNAKIPFNTDVGGISVYTGTFGSAFMNTSGMLAQGASDLQRTDSTNSTQLNKIDGKRQAISSVSIDDEAVSIVQYSQSLNASSRFMTAVDECLQTIINNMGLAGRG